YSICTFTFIKLVLFFSFSSRRRHTRCYRDWSSDVCSSDLPKNPRPTRYQQSSTIASSAPWLCARTSPGISIRPIPCCNSAVWTRSEERRVGKECRVWWWVDEVKIVERYRWDERVER